MALAEALGLNPTRAFETVRRGAGASFMLDDRGRRLVDPAPRCAAASPCLSGTSAWWPTSHVVGASPPAAARLFSEAAAARGADHDDTELYDYVRGAARLVEVVAPGALGRPTEQVHRLARADAGRVDA